MERHAHKSNATNYKNSKGKKTQIQKRYIELQPTLHHFQQKQFESPDTVNNLRYDSQKCWTALAKLFINEAPVGSITVTSHFGQKHTSISPSVGHRTVYPRYRLAKLFAAPRILQLVGGVVVVATNCTALRESEF
jgi:hypothetical protein